ncbi:hypothetical protein EBR43_08920 [bacterium]|nr:hypothetical protein [bacterium]
MNYIYAVSGTSSYITLKGYSLGYTEFVVVSSFDTSKTQPLCAFKPDSNKFTEISGTPYYNFTIESSNIINVNVEDLDAGIYDVVFFNVAGYSKLSDKNSLLYIKEDIN